MRRPKIRVSRIPGGWEGHCVCMNGAVRLGHDDRLWPVLRWLLFGVGS